MIELILNYEQKKISYIQKKNQQKNVKQSIWLLASNRNKTNHMCQYKIMHDYILWRFFMN